MGTGKAGVALGRGRSVRVCDVCVCVRACVRTYCVFFGVLAVFSSCVLSGISIYFQRGFHKTRLTLGGSTTAGSPVFSLSFITRVAPHCVNTLMILLSLSLSLSLALYCQVYDVWHREERLRVTYTSRTHSAPSPPRASVERQRRLCACATCFPTWCLRPPCSSRPCCCCSIRSTRRKPPRFCRKARS